MTARGGSADSSFMNRSSAADFPVLVINCGSTTIKFQLIETHARRLLVKGSVDRIGRPDCGGKMQTYGAAGVRRTMDLPDATHAAALKWIFDGLPPDAPPAAIGHRVVHGGAWFSSAAPVNEDTIRKIEDCIPLAPLHNPVELMGIRECLKLHGEIPQIASFDTAFHQRKPALTSVFPLPPELARQYGYRKFGFHGASHQYVSQRAAALLERDLGSLKLVSCHLGGGSSVTAVQDGVAVDTSATFGTFTGMPMGTRAGDIDAGVILDLITRQGLSGEEVADLLYTQSGLLALSGVSGDMAELEKLEAQGHEGAHLAREYYAYALKRFIGGFAAVMNGIDGIIFTGGIGENDADLRARVCRDLAWLGISLDATKNRLSGQELIVSGPDSRIAVLVVPTNEELAIALEAADRIAGPSGLLK